MMSAAKYVMPKKQDIEKYLELAQSLDDTCEHTIKRYKKQENELTELTDKIRNRTTKQFYNETTIDEFLKMYPVVNPKLLKKQNIQTVKQLDKILHADKNIKGVDIKTTTILLSSTLRYRRQLVDNLEIELLFDRKDKTCMELIERMYLLDREDKWVSELETIHLKLNNKLGSSLDLLESTSFWKLRWRFSSKKKKRKISQAYSKVKKFVKVNRPKAQYNKSEIQLIERTVPKVIYKDFMKHTNQYKDLLEVYQIYLITE